MKKVKDLYSENYKTLMKEDQKGKNGKKPHVYGLKDFSSVTRSCPTVCDPMNCSTPGLLVHHQLLEFTQTHVH